MGGRGKVMETRNEILENLTEIEVDFLGKIYHVTY